MARVPPPRSPVFEGSDPLDLQIREVAARLAVEWAHGTNCPGSTFAHMVRYFETYLRTGKTGAPK